MIRTVGDEPAVDYCLCHADPKVPLSKLARVHGARHRIEESLEEAKQEVGLGQYEVRSWVGWHHHMTLCLLALWFLTLQRRRIGKKKGGDHRLANPSGIHRVVAPTAPHGPANRPDDYRRADTQRGNTDLQVARGHGALSTAQAA